MDLPWERAEDVYDDDGPAEPVEFEVDGHLMRVAPIGVTALNTARMRFEVRCLSCNSIVHEATTAATTRVEQHLRGAL